MNRKNKKRLQRNIGGAYQTDVQLSTSESAILLVERVIKSLLSQTVDQMKGNKTELTRFFSHFFDPTSDTTERDEFVKRFMARPPTVRLGYARTSADFPCYAIVMESEDEQEAFLADHAGQDDDVEFTGGFWDSVYAVYVYAEHPDECQMLYQVAKSIVHAGKGFLLACGVLDVSLTGAELAPDETYMPDNMFVRVLRVHAKAPMSVPHILASDPRKIRITGIFGSDIVVDGMVGAAVAVTVPEGS